MQGELHSGHRERMLKRLADYPDSLSDHELLEVLLYAFIPRTNTNPIAHDLIDSFGGLDKVFSASAKELTAVKGVGEKTAANIVLFGKLTERAEKLKTKEKDSGFLSFDKVKTQISELFRGVTEERFYMFLLDKKLQTIYKHKIESDKNDMIIADLSEVANILTLKKPVYAVIAHNHPSGNPVPSRADDEATKKFWLICSLHGVNFVEHLIVGKKDVYSYFGSGRLDEIKREIYADERKDGLKNN